MTSYEVRRQHIHAMHGMSAILMLALRKLWDEHSGSDEVAVLVQQLCELQGCLFHGDLADEDLKVVVRALIELRVRLDNLRCDEAISTTTILQPERLKAMPGPERRDQPTNVSIAKESREVQNNDNVREH